jgi:hypothetical protein
VKALTSEQIEHFIQNGYVRLNQAFSRIEAERARKILWRGTGCDPGDPSTWTRPVVWLGDYDQEPFREAANTPLLHSAFDELVGKGRWLPRRSLGAFPVRFPCHEDTGDTGWHVDASFPGEDSDPNDFLTWRVNLASRGRALLMLFLFSDVGERDAPTRIRAGSHLVIAKLLEPAGELGATPNELDYTATADCDEVIATGDAGTVYLCHPFLVHAAQINRGKQPRFMAQPPLYPAEACDLRRADPAASSAVEMAIRRGLGWGL